MDAPLAGTRPQSCAQRPICQHKAQGPGQGIDIPWRNQQARPCRHGLRQRPASGRHNRQAMSQGFVNHHAIALIERRQHKDIGPGIGSRQGCIVQLSNKIDAPGKPFFDPDADPAVNYGAIGGVIGHEMGHGFDDQGSKSDWRGVQRNWWTDEDRARFEARTKALVAQYNQFCPLEGYCVNGQLALGENIGDLGGLSMAWTAYQLSLDGKEAPVLEGLTGAQRFFLAWAQIWKSKYRDEAMINQVKVGPHSPPQFRINGPLRNLDEWYEAFDVQPTDKLYLPPEERVRIW